MERKPRILIYIDGVLHGSAKDVAIEFDRSIPWVYDKLDAQFWHGHKFSRNAPKPVDIPIYKTLLDSAVLSLRSEHVPGTPLIRHPITCLISSNWRG